MASIIAHAVFVLLFMALNLLFDRAAFIQYLPIYLGLFLSYLAIFRFSKKQLITSVLLAVLLRITCLVIFPTFSEDFYRFHWDGLLVSQGYNPYEMTPSKVMDSDLKIEGIDQNLFAELNSPNYHSVYPPLAQLIFSLGAFLFPVELLYSMISMKLFILLFEMGSLFILIKLLKQFKLDPSLSLLYIWNPLVLLEGAVNMHLEVIAVFFILLFIYLWKLKRFSLSGLAFASAALIKLVPLIFLPIILFKTPLKQSLKFLLSLAACFLIFHLPLLYTGGISGFSESLLLYFQVFEFNASIYYLISFISYGLMGYNAIQIIGPTLALISLIAILSYSWLSRKGELINSMIWILFIFLALSTTVHPWYIIPLIALGIFKRYRFPFVWSLLIFLSYAAYSSDPVHESPLILGLEYITLAVVLFFDLKSSDRSVAG